MTEKDGETTEQQTWEIPDRARSSIMYVMLQDGYRTYAAVGWIYPNIHIPPTILISITSQTTERNSSYKNVYSIHPHCTSHKITKALHIWGIPCGRGTQNYEFLINYMELSQSPVAKLLKNFPSFYATWDSTPCS
jgi:hypothetical protein